MLSVFVLPRVCILCWWHPLLWKSPLLILKLCHCAIRLVVCLSLELQGLPVCLRNGTCDLVSGQREWSDLLVPFILRILMSPISVARVAAAWPWARETKGKRVRASWCHWAHGHQDWQWSLHVSDVSWSPQSTRVLWCRGPVYTRCSQWD